MSDRFEIEKPGADQVTYRLNVTRYVFDNIIGFPGRIDVTYSYRISDPRQDGQMRILLDTGWCGSLSVDTMEEAKTEALAIFETFLADPQPL